MDIIKEACVGNYIEAKKAYEKGANRIELCDNLAEGGTTPSYGTVALSAENLDLDIFPIIRPRGGNFVFSEDEIKIMERDIDLLKTLNIDGVVIGALTENNEIDEEAIKRLIARAGDLNITFHMAFDEIKDKKSALDKLVELGINRILTKGGKNSALDNKDVLKELIDYAENRITILLGGKVTKDNYEELVKYTGAREVHGTKIV